jgi:hypothetical protein
MALSLVEAYRQPRLFLKEVVVVGGMLAFNGFRVAAVREVPMDR